MVEENRFVCVDPWRANAKEVSALKVGLIGLGDIAQKAYLPVIGVRNDVTLHFCTRNENKLQQLGAAYRIDSGHRYNSLDSLLRVGLDAVFVHAATDAHYEIVERCLVEGLHVFVDKPVTYTLKETEELIALAQRNRRLLTVGFNRRFAPLYRGLHEQGVPDIAIMQKNRVGLPGDVRTFVLDDFIHVIDTLRWLLRGWEPSVHVRCKSTAEGKLAHVIVQLGIHQSTAIGIMNRDSGAVEETLEWMKDGQKCKVTNLREMVRYKDNQEHHTHAEDWTSVGHVRGFHAMVDAFLIDVKRLQRDDDAAWEAFSAMMEEDLATHRICEEIVRQIDVVKNNSGERDTEERDTEERRRIH